MNLIFDFKLSKFYKNLNLISLINGEKKINLIGEFAIIQKHKDDFLCLRDPIGAKKLFYYKNKKKTKLPFLILFLN
jgi:asparagine synthetase B (glutamine-hydrolysing)